MRQLYMKLQNKVWVSGVYCGGDESGRKPDCIYGEWCRHGIDVEIQFKRESSERSGA